MAAARRDKFIGILANVLRLLYILESISLREQLGNAIRIVVERRRDVSGVSAFDKSLIFRLLPFVLTHAVEASDPIVLVASPLNALMRDQISNLTA